MRLNAAGALPTAAKPQEVAVCSLCLALGKASITPGMPAATVDPRPSLLLLLLLLLTARWHQPLAH